MNFLCDLYALCVKKDSKARLSLIALLILLFTQQVTAQQLPLYSQYRQNGFIINPALTGVDEHKEVTATYRRQWHRMPGAPETATLGYRHYFEDDPMGVGGYLIYDKTGPTSSIGINGTYSYHIDFDRREVRRLSFGISGGLYQYRLNGSELVLDDPNDAAIYTNNVSKILPDAGFGVVYYTKQYFGGISVPQAISMNVKFEGDDGLSEIRRIAHFYALGGGKFHLGIDEQYLIEPTVWVKYAPHSPINVDLNTRVTLDDMIILGVGYNTSNTALLDLGVKIAQRAKLLYGLSFHFSKYHSYLGFNHEVTITYTFDAPEHYYDY